MREWIIHFPILREDEGPHSRDKKGWHPVCRRITRMKKNYLLLAFLLFNSFSFFGCTMMMKADMKMSINQYQEAIPLYVEYLKGHPDSIEGTRKLGLAYFFASRLDEAIEQFSAVLKRAPDDDIARLRIGQAFVNNGEIGKAAEVWQGYDSRAKLEIQEEVGRLQKFLRIFENKKSGERITSAEEEILKSFKITPEQLQRFQLSDVANIVNHSIEKALMRQYYRDCLK